MQLIVVILGQWRDKKGNKRDIAGEYHIHPKFGTKIIAQKRKEGNKCCPLNHFLC